VVEEVRTYERNEDIATQTTSKVAPQENRGATNQAKNDADLERRTQPTQKISDSGHQ